MLCASLELQPQLVFKAKLISLLMQSDIIRLSLWKALLWGYGAGPGGSIRALEQGRGPQGCQGSVVLPFLTSPILWTPEGELGCAGDGDPGQPQPGHPQAPWSLPGRHPLGWGQDEDGIRAVPSSGEPRARQGQGCSTQSAYQNSHY